MNNENLNFTCMRLTVLASEWRSFFSRIHNFMNYKTRFFNIIWNKNDQYVLLKDRFIHIWRIELSQNRFWSIQDSDIHYWIARTGSQTKDIHVYRLKLSDPLTVNYTLRSNVHYIVSGVSFSIRWFVILRKIKRLNPISFHAL